MKRAMYLILAVVILVGAQAFAPPSEAQIQRTGPVQVQRDVPMQGFQASLQVGADLLGYLIGVKGIGNENEVIEQKLVQAKVPLVQKMPGRLKISDIVLRRAISTTTTNLDFFEWRKKVMQGKMVEARKSGSITFYDAALKVVAIYNFFNGWPSQYRGITLDGQSGYAEELVLTVEGIERVK